jgi:hypothetical protein
MPADGAAASPNTISGSMRGSAKPESGSAAVLPRSCTVES